MEIHKQRNLSSSQRVTVKQSYSGYFSQGCCNFMAEWDPRKISRQKFVTRAVLHIVVFVKHVTATVVKSELVYH